MICAKFVLKKFLSYVENEHAEDEFTRLLDKEVKNARLNEEWRSEYLKTYVNDMDMKREGYLEGETEKEKELLQNLMKTMHLTESEAREKLGINSDKHQS